MRQVLRMLVKGWTTCWEIYFVLPFLFRYWVGLGVCALAFALASWWGLVAMSVFLSLGVAWRIIHTAAERRPVRNAAKQRG